MDELLPRIKIVLPEIQDHGSIADRSSPSPLAGEVRRGDLPRSSSSTLLPDLSAKSRAPSLVPSRKGRRIIPHALDPFSLFAPTPRDIWLEIGFGGGEHLAAQAALHPDIGFLGAEPFLNGIASLLAHIDKDKIANIRIYPDDARALLDALPDDAIARCYVLFADPWPKARHAERRFIGPENLPRLARVLRDGGELIVATDDAVLAPWMLEHLDAHAAFAPHIPASPQPLPGWIPTRYEKKALAAGRWPVYASYRRQNRV
jgi:tRNA (guanine-N7-)-methyltransferase